MMANDLAGPLPSAVQRTINAIEGVDAAIRGGSVLAMGDALPEAMSDLRDAASELAFGRNSLKPCAWMAHHGRQPTQATVRQQQADAWAQAGGDVVELYDGVTVWNAIASTDARRRELQAQIEQLQDRLARAGIEQQRAVLAERERCVRILEAYRVPVGNSAAGEMAADWTMEALHEIRAAIRGA